MIKKIRLLQVIPNMGIGGAETGCRHVAEYVSEHAEFSSILTSGGSQLDMINSKVKVFKWPISKNIVTILLNIFYIFFLIKKNNINIVHVRSRGPAWSCYLACKLSGAKMVTTFHGTYNFTSSIKKYYNSIMLKSDYVIAGSDFILSHVKRNYKTINNITVIKRGIDQHYFDPSNVPDHDQEILRKEMGFSKDNFLVLLPGRLTSWKGQMLLIESANYLKTQDKISNIFFIILGDSQGKHDYEDKLKKLILSYKMVDKVRLVQPLQNMPLAYAAVNLVVSASIEPEAFGRVSIEAQAMKKPILASAIGGSIETVLDKKTGWLFKPNNIKDLANNIYNISKMEKSALKTIGSEGRKNVSENYTKDIMCLKTLEIYHSLVY
jgi:glycosyltransferase involved in cell wall biosynthesis